MYKIWAPDQTGILRSEVLVMGWGGFLHGYNIGISHSFGIASIHASSVMERIESGMRSHDNPFPTAICPRGFGNASYLLGEVHSPVSLLQIHLG